jgi:hypothetical protein
LNIKPDHSFDIEGDLVEQGIPKLSYFDQSDAHDKKVKGKHTNQIFHLDTIVMKNTNDINQFYKDCYYRKPYLLKLTI